MTEYSGHIAKESYPKCKDCKYFLPVSERGKELGDENRCQNPKFRYEEDLADDGMRAQDAEGYSAWIEVGENFGYIHFSNKSNRNDTTL